jgi:uncharacterized protein
MQKNVWMIIGLIACAILFANVRPVEAQDRSNSARTINVTGDAEVKVAPDEVILILGVETLDKDIRTAKRQNDESIKKLLALTRDFGIDPKYVQTDQINVDPRYRNGYYVDSDFIGYAVRKYVVVTLKDISRFEDFYTAILNAGANHVYGIQFRTTELRKYRDQARALAIQAAREKAGAMSRELGQTIGQPQSIQENYSNWSAWYDMRWGGGAMTQNVVQNVSSASMNEQGTFAPGQISVTARVTVAFELK